MKSDFMSRDELSARTGKSIRQVNNLIRKGIIRGYVTADGEPIVSRAAYERSIAGETPMPASPLPRKAKANPVGIVRIHERKAS